MGGGGGSKKSESSLFIRDSWMKTEKKGRGGEGKDQKDLQRKSLRQDKTQAKRKNAKPLSRDHWKKGARDCLSCRISIETANASVSQEVSKTTKSEGDQKKTNLNNA